MGWEMCKREGPCAGGRPFFPPPPAHEKDAVDARGPFHNLAGTHNTPRRGRFGEGHAPRNDEDLPRRGLGFRTLLRKLLRRT